MADTNLHMTTSAQKTQAEHKPSGAARPSSTLPMPAVVRRLFSATPIYQWPAAHAEDDMAPPRPTLYIAPSANGSASADPTCLRWQFELDWRGIEYDTVEVTGYCWGPHGRFPFLRDVAERGGRVVGAEMLPLYVDTHFPYTRPELGEKTQTLPESGAWQSLLEGRVMAGALLLALQSGSLDAYGGAAPCFWRSLLPQLPGERSLSEAAMVRLNELSSAGASVVSVNSTSGKTRSGDIRNPISRVPSYTIDWTSWITGTASDNVDSEDLESADMHIDEAVVAEQAAEALKAVGVRLGDDTWLLGAEYVAANRKPTTLDALLAASLHTISAHAREGALYQAARMPQLAAYARRVADK